MDVTFRHAIARLPAQRVKLTGQIAPDPLPAVPLPAYSLLAEPLPAARVPTVAGRGAGSQACAEPAAAKAELRQERTHLVCGAFLAPGRFVGRTAIRDYLTRRRWWQRLARARRSMSRA